VMNPIERTIRQVRGTMARNGMIESGDVVIVAVSGGLDSVCLLDILSQLTPELGIELVVAHFDHGLRPAEDEVETCFVRDLAARMKLPFEAEKGFLLAGTGAASLEEKARDARYTFLQAVRRKHRAQKIAVGHNLDDQAETVLMRLLRGSSPTGLAGIPPHRNRIVIRPLLETRRIEIAAYAEAKALKYVTDSSNLQATYLRNRIRLELIPALRMYQPRLIEHLGRLASVLRSENEYLEASAEAWIEREANRNPEGDTAVAISSFLGCPEPIRRRVTRRLLIQVKKTHRRIGHSHIESVDTLARGDKPQAALALPDGIRVKRIYDRLVFTRRPQERPGPFQVSLEGPGEFSLEAAGRSVVVEEIRGDSRLDFSNRTWAGFLDADKVRFPLILRNPRPGDRFVPLGMAGHRKLKDFFIDLKVPSEERANTPILVWQGTAVCICGYRVDDRFKVTPRTERILKITMG
jgi:tRNA(Ile)-lysidine synthase